MEEGLSFTTSSGRVVPLKRIARRHVERVRAKHKPPETPTYTFTAAGGVEVTRKHDESTIEEGTPEERAEWLEYQAALSKHLLDLETDTVRFLVYNCIDAEPDPVEEWSVDFALWGLDPPSTEDLVAFKVEWFESELCVDQEDYAPFISMLYQMGGLLGEDAAKEFEAFFRLTVARLSAQ